MRQFFDEFKAFFRKGDLLLLLLCLGTNIFGAVMIASTTNYRGSAQYVIIHLAAGALGVLFYIFMSSIDVDVFHENRIWLVLFNTFLLLLLVPFGTDLGSGNRSWLDFPFLPVDIQPAEICKITYILIMASVMTNFRSQISSIKAVFFMVFHLLLLAGLNMGLSSDLGVSLIFVFIFIVMAYTGGVNAFWFILAGSAVAVGAPIVWNSGLLKKYQMERLEVLWNPKLDPMGVDARFHSVRSLKSLTGGGFFGQGLFNGIRTQGGELFAQHTDFIFSAIGEELGFLGCAAALAMLGLIVWRCIAIGRRTPDYTRKLVCFGAAAALTFQILINVGMCIGIMPVIGLTLPFISYGGSSVVSLYAMLGLVSGVCARPVAPTHERYIRHYA